MSITLQRYILLTKPGIIMGNVITATAGFFLASHGEVNYSLFMAMLGGLSSIIASACILNNVRDRFVDQKMERTKHRALAAGTISITRATVLAIFLGLLGTWILATYANFITASVALFGVFAYLVLYGISKYHSHHGTLIGSLAGAVPPVVGYSAAAHSIDTAALLLFFIVVFWQMPHFYAIALYRLEDYRAASIPVLPLQRSLRVTKLHMLFYTTGFTLASLSLFALDFAGYLYLAVATFVSLFWLALCLTGFKSTNDKAWARKMFLFSLIAITLLSAAIVLDA